MRNLLLLKNAGYNKLFNLTNLEYYILFKLKKKYLKLTKSIFLSKIKVGNVVFVEVLNYEFFGTRKYFFLGLCVDLIRNKISSGFILRNVIGGILVEQQFIIFNKMIIFLRISKKRFVDVGLKKSKLFFLLNLPFFFRINKFALLETFYYINKKKLRIRNQKKKKLKK
jgi:ribosomal protein L19